MKKSLVKKIVSISIIALALALVITTVVLALVPKTLSNPLPEGYACIAIYRDGTAQQYQYIENATTDVDKAQNKVFEDVERLHGKSLQDKLLSSILQGATKYEINVVQNTVSSVMSNEVKKEGVNAIVFTYLADNADDKFLLEINGELYGALSEGGATVAFTEVVMVLNNNTEFEECTLYLLNNNTSSQYQVRFLARQAELYDYVENFTFSIQG